MIKLMLKKLIISLSISLILIFSSVSPVHAQQWYEQSFPEWYSKVYGSPENEIFGERYTAAQVQWIFFSLLSFPFRILGPDLSLCLFSGEINNCLPPLFSRAQESLPSASTSPSEKGGLLSLILADRPLSGITYFKNIFRKFHLIPEAQAQGPGFGYNALEPTLFLWKGSRNIAYALLVLITIILSFMIMFRVKISPQVAISVQSALPKLAIAIVLVTFSYAIAGFLVDLMYVTIGLLSIAFQSYLPGKSVTEIFNLLTKGQPFDIQYALGVFGLFFLFISVFLVVGVIIFLSMFSLLGVFFAAAPAVIMLATPGLNGFVILFLALLMLIVFVILLYHFIRILWMLTKTFVNILLLTIFAPFQLILGALIPSVGFGAWVKSFASSLAVFVVTGALFLLSLVFLDQAAALAIIDYVDDPAILGNILFGTHVTHSFTPSSIAYWPPLLSIGGGGASTNIGAALLFWAASFAIFAIIPRTAELIQSFIQGKPFGYGTAIGEATTGLIVPGAQTVAFVQKVGGPIGKLLTSFSRKAGTPEGSESPAVPGQKT